MYSIIIPTLNEEKYLPKLLESLKAMNRSDYEVIVADAFSKDKTREVAMEYDAKVVDGGPISIGRNKGAEAAQFDILIFLDSDVTVDPDFLDRVEKSFVKRNIEIGSVYFHKDTGKKSTDMAYVLWDTSKKVRQYFKNPDATGGCIVVSRDAFDAVHGFDPLRKIGNDTDFVHRVSNAGFKFRMMDIQIHSSTRRYDRVGVGRVMVGNFIAGVVGRENQRAQSIAQFIYGGWGKHDKKVPGDEKNIFQVLNKARQKANEISHRILVYGGTGFVGSSIVEELIKNKYIPILLVRNEDKIPEKWKGNIEYEIGDASNLNDSNRIIKKYTPQAIIYSIGIIREAPNVSFQDAHYNWPYDISLLAKEYGIKKFLYISANGVRMDGVDYQTTKWKFEEYLQKSDFEFTIFRPSIVTSVDGDSDFAKQLDFLTKFRIVPMIGFGGFKFAPINRTQLAEEVVDKFKDSKNSVRETYKLTGKDVKTFKMIVKEYAKSVNRRIIIIPLPVFLFKIMVKLLGRFKWFPLTSDQLKMVLEGNY